MRRQDKALTDEEMLQIINDEQYGILSTVSADCYPYGIPLNYVYDKQAIYLHCAPSGQKLDNIQDNSRVSFCIISKPELLPAAFSMKYKSVVIFGRAQEIFATDKEAALLNFIYKYSKDYLSQGKKYIQEAAQKTRVFKITVEHMTGKGTR